MRDNPDSTGALMRQAAKVTARLDFLTRSAARGEADRERDSLRHELAILNDRLWGQAREKTRSLAG